MNGLPTYSEAPLLQPNGVKGARLSDADKSDYFFQRRSMTAAPSAYAIVETRAKRERKVIRVEPAEEETPSFEIELPENK